MKIRQEAKLICLGLALLAFGVATIVLAVQKSQLKADLRDAKEKLDYLEAELECQTQPKPKQPITTNAKVKNVNYRLPQHLLPMHYDLHLHPELSTGNFTGREEIDIVVKSPTSEIILHSHKLVIKHVDVKTANGENLVVMDYSFDKLREFLVICMAKELKVESAIKLSINFEGTMRDKIVGLYSSTYKTPQMEDRTIATSKFEPTFARQAFPCFDEPAMKATFTVTLVHPTADNYHALSNMNQETNNKQNVSVKENQLMLSQSSNNFEEYTETRFAKTMPMSTYIACFLISDFKHKTRPVYTQGIGETFNIRIFATEHQLDKVDFALATAVAVTEYYIRYFRVEYPLPKLDMAAIPDFVSNAMENWGLVTYRETVLLYDKSTSSTYNQQRIAAVVAHELAHMWFGNLVTMMWWNDLWLNEGFARYIQYKGADEVFPSWGMPELFLIEALHKVMKYDSSIASHPIIQTVETPDQITEIFDTISYEKGASVIRMLENVVGSEKFEAAVTNYLNNFKFSNAVTDDFLTEVEKTGLDFDVKLMMRTWTEQMGYPVIQVERATDQAFHIQQRRFLANIEDYELEINDTPFSYKWTIPITFTFNNQNISERMWLDYNTTVVKINVTEETKWIKLNLNQVGYYRVNYDNETWHAITEDLIAQPTILFSIADRAHLLDDAFALADASQLSYDIALDMTLFLENESEFVPWYVAATKMQDLQKRLAVTEVQTDFLHYARKLITKVYHEVTWNVDEYNHLRNRLRVSILTAACSLGLTDCLDEAARRFEAWLLQPDEKPKPDLREIVYYYGMQRVNTQATWEQMWQLFVTEQDASEKAKLMYGLAAVRLPWLLHRYASLAANEQFVRRQDYFNCLQNIAENPVGEPVIWDYVREEWPAMVDRFGLNERFLGRMIPAITAHFASVTKLEEMDAFFSKYPDAGAGTAARQQAFQTVKYNIKWLEQNKAKIAAWLQKTLR